jgi:hypothetical protein
MSSRAFLQFFRTKTGTFVLFCAVLGIGYGLLRGTGRRTVSDPGPDRKLALDGKKKAQVVESVIRDMTPFQPPKETPKAAQVPPEPVPPRERRKSEVLPISLVASAEKEVLPERTGEEEIAPYGRLVPCELVVTVDSSSIDTPIIGLVTEDVWHQGKRIIPAGTEVHGRARVDRMRERIAAQGQWTFVWQTGEELSLSGLALDREQHSEGGAWGITDGSAGLRGQLLKSDDLAEVRLFAATFLSGAASGLADRESTAFGNQLAGTLKNAQLAGMQQVLNGYAKQIYETIQREGFFVRVPAGKQFYVYVTQTIDKAKSVHGSSGAVTRAGVSAPSGEPFIRSAAAGQTRSSGDLAPFEPEPTAPVAEPIPERAPQPLPNSP